jgi:hypothetical protein
LSTPGWPERMFVNKTGLEIKGANLSFTIAIKIIYLHDARDLTCKA